MPAAISKLIEQCNLITNNKIDRLYTLSKIKCKVRQRWMVFYLCFVYFYSYVVDCNERLSKNGKEYIWCVYDVWLHRWEIIFFVSLITLTVKYTNNNVWIISLTHISVKQTRLSNKNTRRLHPHEQGSQFCTNIFASRPWPSCHTTKKS